MEAAIVNLVEPGDKVLVLKTGIWGGRAKEVVERAGEYMFNTHNLVKFASGIPGVDRCFKLPATVTVSCKS